MMHEGVHGQIFTVFKSMGVLDYSYKFFTMLYNQKYYLFKLCLIKKQTITKDLAALIYHMFKIHDDFNCTLQFLAHFCQFL